VGEGVALETVDRDSLGPATYRPLDPATPPFPPGVASAKPEELQKHATRKMAASRHAQPRGRPGLSFDLDFDITSK
jgi:hypothetical protein